MGNNLKQLLLGMSIGAIVVFFYGLVRLDPSFKETSQPDQKTTENTYDPTFIASINQITEPEVESADKMKQVQFIEIHRLKRYPTLQVHNTPTPSPTIIISPTPIPKPKTTNPEITPATSTSEAISENVHAPKVQTLNAPEEVITLIEKYAAEYGVDKNMMIGIAKCESGFRSNAVNGPYSGIYQFVSGTWISNRRAMGLDENLDLRNNAEESVRTAAFKMSRDGFGAWPVCQYKAQDLVASAESI